MVPTETASDTDRWWSSRAHTRCCPVPDPTARGVQLPCNANQRLGELAVETPVAPLVGIGQVAPREVAAQSQVIRLGRVRFQTRLDVPQALAEGDLGERHAQ